MTEVGSRRRRPGFTLVEMLVAMAVLGVLAVLLAEIANRASAAWMRGEAQASRSQSVRAILGFLAADMRSALRPMDAADQSGFHFVENPAGVGDAFKNRDAVFWQAAVSDSSGGDVGVVGYFVQWLEEDGRPVARLCRLFVEPVDAQGNPNANFQFHADPVAWVSDAIVSACAPATEAQNFSGLLADHVVGLWVRCFDENGVVVDDFDSRVQQKFPSRVEIGLVLLDTRAARRLDAPQAAALRTAVREAGSAGAFLAAVRSSSTLSPLLAHLIPYESTFRLPSAQ